MTNLIDMPISLAWKQAVFLGWNNCFRFILGNKVKQLIGVIATVSQHSCEIKTFQQGNGLRRISALPTRQQQTQWIPQCVHGYMNFCTKATAALAQCLVFLPTVGVGRTSGTRMRSDDGAVNQQP